MTWLPLPLLALFASLFGDGGELERLVGQEVEVRGDGYTIVDIAGEGPPLIGVIEAEGEDLFLQTSGARPVRLQLEGPLAIPRIAGPSYKVWVLGERRGRNRLWVRRLGVLAPPGRGDHPGTQSPID